MSCLCPYCLEPYTSPNRVPLALSCGIFYANSALSSANTINTLPHAHSTTFGLTFHHRPYTIAL